MRLTKKMPQNEYDLELAKVRIRQDVLMKLGQLEDIEEELGLSLITIGKMLVKGFYVKHDSDIEKAIFKGIWLEYKKIYFTTQSYDGELYFDDYGKTWALTKEVLL